MYAVSDNGTAREAFPECEAMMVKLKDLAVMGKKKIVAQDAILAALCANGWDVKKAFTKL